MKCKKSECQANAMKGTRYCFMHNPDTKERHLEAARRGGVATNTGIIRLEELSLDEPQSVIALLRDTINRIRLVRDDGSMDLKTANAIGFLSSHLMKAMELTDIDLKVEEIERIVLERKQTVK